MEIDYGGWLTEDLKELYSELIKERDRLEDYSDRVQELHTLVIHIIVEMVEDLLF